MNRTGDIYMNRIALAVKSALGLVILVPPTLALADSAADTPLEEIVVTGIRQSVEESLKIQRASTDIIDVITAEDIGKMPDKNVADSLARVPGITTSSAGANEGGFDENDRVSMRGTNPSLTQTLINGHNVAAGDWFVLDQTTQVGRSVSYTLLPSEIVSQVVVQKFQRLVGRGRRRGLGGHHYPQAPRLRAAADHFSIGRRRLFDPAVAGRRAVQRARQLEERRQ